MAENFRGMSHDTPFVGSGERRTAAFFYKLEEDLLLHVVAWTAVENEGGWFSVEKKISIYANLELTHYGRAVWRREGHLYDYRPSDTISVCERLSFDYGIANEQWAWHVEVGVGSETSDPPPKGVLAFPDFLHVAIT